MITVSASDQAQISEQVRAASTSFYGAMRILGRERREAIFAIYAFCRTVDDIADDETSSADTRRRELNTWRGVVEALYQGDDTGNVVARSLVRPIADYGLRKADFLAIIDGMEMDAEGPIVAPSWQALDQYCDCVASAVGRLCVHIFGEPGPQGHAVAEHLGRALQITNILRDVGEDARIGRLYLPRELLETHGIDFGEPLDVLRHRSYAAAWRDLADRAVKRFQLADEALARCNRRKMRPARIMLEVYRRNLKRMMSLSDAEIADVNVSKRLVGKIEKIAVALRHGIL